MKLTAHIKKIKPLADCLRFFKKALSPQYLYESFIAKIMARYFFFIYWPFYKVLEYFDVCFVLNIANGVGHVTAELDNFFRMLELNEIDNKKRYFLILKNSELYRTSVRLYKHRFAFASSNTLLYDILLPLMMRFSSLGVDVGVSRMKWHLEKGRSLFNGFPYVFQLSVREGIEEHRRAFEKRLKTSDFFPLLDYESNELIFQNLNLQNKKICLLHIKCGVINATASPIDPKSYLPTLSFLQTQGYQLVFVGREKMPAIFNEFNVINYSESKFATFENDMNLFKKCDFSLIAGSGVSYLADCYNKPYLYLNSWHLTKSMPSQWCISVPSLLEKKNGKPLQFVEQINLYFELNTREEIAPYRDYFARNATEEEILDATKELLELQKNFQKPSSLQQQFQQIHPEGLLLVSKSRVSQAFLEKHKHRF